MDFVYLAREAWKAGNFDVARMYYQKAAYGIHGTNQANKDAFTQEVAQFAGEDPVYQQGIQLIRKYVAEQNKPVLQNEMTVYVKSHFGVQQTEVLRYVLYYAEVRKDIYRQKHGRSYLLALSPDAFIHAELPNKKKREATNTKKKSTPHIKLFEPNVPYHTQSAVYISSSDIAELHREATRYKTEKDWASALACLFKAKDLTHDRYEEMSRRLRLPLFLQQAGYFEAAKHELAYLLENIDNFVAIQVEGQQNLRQRKAFFKTAYLTEFFDKARLIFQREKITDKAKKCEMLFEQYTKKREAAFAALQETRRQIREKQKLSQHQVDRNDIIRAQPANSLLEVPIEHSTTRTRGKKQSHQNSGCTNIIAGFIVVVIFLYFIFH